MKILRLCRTLPSLQNPGAGMHCFKYSILSKYESVILTKENIEDIKNFPRSISIHQMIYRDLTIKSSNLNFIRLILIGLTKLWGELVCLIKAIKLIKQDKFFFIHIHSINYLISGVIIKKLFKLPIGLNLGGTDFYRAKKFWLYRYLLRRVDKIFYVSKEMKNELLEIVEKPALIYTSNGFNSEIFYNLNQSREDYLISVGNLRWQKNHTLLIESFLKVSEAFPDFKLLILGSGPDKQNLEDLVKKLKLTSRVVFYGQVNQKDIADLMNKSKVFCLSSLSEGFPKVILEAFSCGLPVISTDVGDCKNIIENGGIIADGNVEEYSAKIIDLLRSSNFEEYGKKAQQISLKYSWDNVVNHVDSAYELYTLRN